MNTSAQFLDLMSWFLLLEEGNKIVLVPISESITNY